MDSVVSVHYKLLENVEILGFDYSFIHVRYDIYDSILDDSENAFHVASVPADVSLEKEDSNVDNV